MYFSQEDYIKIENWLYKKSIKDSDFEEAEPLNGNELIAIVQNGSNKKISIREFVNKLYRYNINDFLNVTSIYKINNINLEEAISSIPAENRKEGQVITFLNTMGNWEIHQFIGKLAQWDNLALWINPLIPIIDNTTFSFGKNNELQLDKVDGGTY